MVTCRYLIVSQNGIVEVVIVSCSGAVFKSQMSDTNPFLEQLTHWFPNWAESLESPGELLQRADNQALHQINQISIFRSGD